MTAAPRRARVAGLGMLVLAGTLAVSAQRQADAAGDALHVASWGGAYQQSQALVLFDPFTKATQIAIDPQAYDGSLEGIKAMLSGDNPPDVVDVSSAVLSQLCDDKQLARLDPSILSATDATGSTPGTGAAVSPRQDFLPGALSACGVGSLAWSAPIVFDTSAYKKNQPSKISDLLDDKLFPGKRALPATPSYTLELALEADGVAPADVYRTLATPEGLDRAFAALDKIKPDIVWWDKPGQPLTWLKSGKAAMALGYTGRIFRASAETPGKYGVIWDGQIYDVDSWAIPRGSKQQAEAKQFIAYASDPARLAQMSDLTAYGPLRKSAIAEIGKHPTLGTEMTAFVPTAADHFDNALKYDSLWWKQHGDAIAKRFDDWRNGTGSVEQVSEDPHASQAKQ